MEIRLFDPAIVFLEVRTMCPALGVIPYRPALSLMEEDSLMQAMAFKEEAEIDIAIVHHRSFSNFTDFDLLAVEEGVAIRFARSSSQMGWADVSPATTIITS